MSHEGFNSTGKKMDYTIRKMEQSEVHVLPDFLYEAIFIPEGITPPSREIINQPELQVYISDFGKRDSDICYVAEANGKIVGAAWVRIMKDFVGSIGQTASDLSGRSPRDSLISPYTPDFLWTSACPGRWA